MFSKLMRVDWKLNDVLLKVGEPIDFVYFPNTAMASVLTLMEDGKMVEVGLVGSEGMIGLGVIAGFKTSASRVVAQGEGTAFRLDAKSFRESLPLCPKMGVDLLRYSLKFTMQTAQIAACNRLHEVNERLARWLLMTHDRVRRDFLPLTQEFLGQMLGTRRASVTVAAGILQQAGLIKYVHGQVTILNRKGLEEASCECYAVIRNQLETWKKESQ
jgi:CRP-like cAMP-binding protein